MSTVRATDKGHQCARGKLIPSNRRYATGRCDTPEEREFCRAYNVMESVAEWTPTVGMSGAVTTIVEANMRKPCRHAQRFPRRPPGVIGRVGILASRKF